MDQKILIVDDDQQVTSFLLRFFKKHGYLAATAATSAELFAAIATQSFDLIVLDLILPDEDGLEAAKRLRKTHDTPIIILSARDEVLDRIVGLELGADDYLTKPYEPRELLARVRSVLRRFKNGSVATEDTPKKMQFAGVELDLMKSTACRLSDGADIQLTSTEFALLRILAEAGGADLTRDRILSTLYGNAVQITDRAIDAHIARLRRKLAKSSGETDLIKTIHGVGYKLTAAVRPL